MALGEAIYQDFKILLDNPEQQVVDLGIEELRARCCFNLPALAQIGGTDPYKNDKAGVLWFYGLGVTGALMMLQKEIGGEFMDDVVLDNDDLGTLYEFGFEINSRGESLMGFLIDWSKVLEQRGEGKYRVKTVEDTIFATELNQYSFEYCLETYTSLRADGTVRIDFWNAGIMGNTSDDTKTRDFGDFIFYTNVRLPDSIFALSDKSAYEKEYVRYRNGREVWNKDKQAQEYSLKTGLLPAYLHNYLRTDMMQAEETLITDYNSVNPNRYIGKPVKSNSAYEIPYLEGALLTSVELTFDQLYKNLIHKRC